MNILRLHFWWILIFVASLYFFCDVMGQDMAVLSSTGSQARFIVSAVMILLTLALVPLALRLFTLRRVKDDLIDNGITAMRKWGIIRIYILGGLLVINAMLYYFFGDEPAFGYLAIVVLLTMPFVYPTKKRCLAEMGMLEEEVDSTEEEE